jgi:hypothetical protein
MSQNEMMASLYSVIFLDGFCWLEKGGVRINCIIFEYRFWESAMETLECHSYILKLKPGLTPGIFLARRFLERITPAI